MRINKYLAHKKYGTRREADEMVEEGRVMINGVRAKVGDKVRENDDVQVTFKPRTYRYFAYHKPRGIITHSPQGDEEAIEDIMPIEGVFPIGRLDKDSFGLILLTDDGRVTDALLNPAHEHEKEYEVTCRDELPAHFEKKMEAGVDIGDYVTKPCRVRILNPRAFSITLTEGKKHQIRRMCGYFGMSATHLKRVRIMNITLGNLKPGEYRAIKGAELAEFLKSIGL